MTFTKPRLKKQKGAIEKIIFLAQLEIVKLRKRVRPPKGPTRHVTNIASRIARCRLYT